VALLIEHNNNLEEAGMSTKTFLSVASIIGLLFGIMFVLTPHTFGEIYGMPRSTATTLMARYFGCALLAWALITWLGREFDREHLRAILIGGAVGHAVGALITVNGILSGVMNALGWSSVLIFVLGAGGCLYYLMAGSRKAIHA
jgi:hypothetical protein